MSGLLARGSSFTETQKSIGLDTGPQHEHVAGCQNQGQLFNLDDTSYYNAVVETEATRVISERGK